jgi:hypothetical protein
VEGARVQAIELEGKCQKENYQKRDPSAKALRQTQPS